jgi:hypothetical protein
MVDGRARFGCEAGKSFTKEFAGRIIRLLTGRGTIGAALASLISIGWILRTNEAEQSHAMESSHAAKSVLLDPIEVSGACG